MKKILKGGFLLIIGMLLFSMTSCEDDPILELESEDDCVGSYCKLAVPDKDTKLLANLKNPKEF